MASTPVRTSTLADFWKDDFAPLQAAGQAVLEALRDDEAAPDADLYRRISGSGVGSHLYFPTTTTPESSKNVVMTMKHIKSVPLPPLLTQQLQSTKSHSFMGLLAPASLAWMSVDDTVFLWPFQEPGSFCSFKVPSGQCIVTVGLIPPKKGVFKPNVEWCLVVTTPDEVILCALARQTTPTTTTPTATPDASTNGGGGGGGLSHGDGGILRLVHTSFTLATDNVRMRSVCGTACGRIFLGGDDGCLYEMTYEGLVDQQQQQQQQYSVEERLTEFYDQGKPLPDVLTVQGSHVQEFWSLGKRAWNSMTTSSSSSSGDAVAGGARPRKCRKLNRTSHISSWASAILPDILVKTGSFLFGGKTWTGGGKIVRMDVDEDRQCLYTLSSTGVICSFDLRRSGNEEAARLTAVMKTPQIARLYLEAVSRGQMLPPSTSRFSGSITFPGGGAAAQAGVGGMEGARAVLKAADFGGKVTDRNGRSSSSARYIDNILKPISIHVVPPSESQRLTLMAVTAGGLRLYLSSLASNILSSGPRSSDSRALAPSSRLTLCHIRSPPPADMERIQDLSSVDSGIIGGIKPRISGALDKIPRLDAGFYKKGIFVAAVENQKKRQAELSRQKKAVGNIIVSACPDSVARKIETLEETKDKTTQALSFPGGVTEAISMPMSTAYGASAQNFDPILPGGVVWDFAPVSDEERPVVTLTTNSQTPTDTELSIGLPPAYFPPSKIRSRSLSRAATANGGTVSPRAMSSEAIVPHNATMSATALRVLGNVLTSFILSRPIRQGVAFQKPLVEGEFGGEAGYVPNYRVSKRDGTNGFSATAGEVRSSRSRSPSKGSRASKSARLRPWLLRPAAVPLNQISTQHLVQTAKELVALNAGGLHYFNFNSVLSNLAEAMMSSGENVTSDPIITSFFTSYSYKEGCAMCLALAAGCGPAAGDAGYNEQIRTRASAAALARAYVPKLVAQSEQSGNSMVSTTPTRSEPLVPSGYEFQPSALSSGLLALFSRLLRPVWYKPAVVVTEGRTIKHQWSTRTTITPAKVELLLGEESLKEVLTPLQNLLTLMRNVFSRAVKAVPGAPHHQDSMMDIDDESGETHYITRALQYHGHLRAVNGGPRNHLTPAESEAIARLIEEKNIHSLYRLLARAVQLLNLMSLLRRAQSMTELKEVDWGLLHGLTFSQLAQSSDGQDRLERLLNSLVTSSASDDVAYVAPSAEADQLASLFAEQCYLFFSPGSRSAYLGLRRAAEALAYPPASSRYTSLANQAANYLRTAAKHWHSAPLITGRILHTKGQENYDQIAFRALQYGSPLAKAVEALLRLEDVASVVDVCLITAMNFKVNDSVGSVSQETLGLQGLGPTHSFPWEQNLYHKRRVPESGDTSTPSRPPSSPSSPSQIVAYGASVTSKDAVDTCYALVFHSLSVLLRSSPDLADRMVSACAASTDRSFLEAFFLFLLDSNNADTLLRIDSPALDKWLRERNDPDLLWRYYNVQRNPMEAGRVSWDRANDTRHKLSLAERIDCLTRALNAYSAALEDARRVNHPFGSTEELVQKVKEVNDTLHIARLQYRILRTVDSLKSSLDTELNAEKYERLSTTIVPVSELYNDYAAPLALFEHCLLILHACRHDDVVAIQGLWKNVVCEEILPCGTRSEFVYSFLQNFVVDMGLGDAVKFLSETEGSDSLTLFESGDWAKPLEARVINLGKELYGTGADYVFPVDYLLGILEELREAAGNSIPSGWSLMTLAEAGVPFLVILDAYESLAQKEDRLLVGGADPSKRLEYLGNMVGLIDFWVSSCQSTSFGGDGANAAKVELSRAMASGRLMPKIDGLRAKLEMIPEAAGLLEQVRSIEERLSFAA